MTEEQKRSRLRRKPLRGCVRSWDIGRAIAGWHAKCSRVCPASLRSTPPQGAAGIAGRSISGALPLKPRDLSLWASNMPWKTSPDTGVSRLVRTCGHSRLFCASARKAKLRLYHVTGPKRKISGVWGQAPRGGLRTSARDNIIAARCCGRADLKNLGRTQRVCPCQRAKAVLLTHPLRAA